MKPVRYSELKVQRIFVENGPDRVGVFEGFGLPPIADCGPYTEENELKARRVATCLELCKHVSTNALMKLLRNEVQPREVLRDLSEMIVFTPEDEPENVAVLEAASALICKTYLGA